MLRLCLHPPLFAPVSASASAAVFVVDKMVPKSTEMMPAAENAKNGSQIAGDKHSADKVDTTLRLCKLRECMKSNNVAAYIIPSEDAHQSEYIADCDARRAYISGFTGSAGLAVVTPDAAALWTDGRYFLQASKQLDSNWTLMKGGLPDVPTKEEWLVKVLPPKSRVGIDPSLVSVGAYKILTEALEKGGHQLVGISVNLIDIIWDNRPARPMKPVNVHPVKYSGKSSADKIKELREQFEKKNVWGFVVTALDEIAWLFNLRGSDVVYNPVFFSYALVTKKEIVLYIDSAKLSSEVRSFLGDDVAVRPYTAIFDDLKSLSAARDGLSAEAKTEKLWIDSRCNQALLNVIGDKKMVEESRSPVMTAKSIKSQVECDGLRESHKRDAAALISFFAWLENELVVKKNTGLSESDAADILANFRSQQSVFVSLSFDTISSVGPHAAIIHYKPEKGSDAVITVDKIYLCDSGGQYLDGTTDVTRTLHFGTPTQAEKEAFTLVLKGHIQLDTAVFPKGTTGYVLDVLARAALWKFGLDYRHGTGHGVGSFLNVHEGPQGIGQRIAYNDIPLEPGMSMTNEPGYYEDNAFGMRIENVMLVREVSTPHRFGGGPYYGFEHLTLVPIQSELIDVSLLTPEEIKWVNAYHDECWEIIAPLLEANSLAWNWLKRECIHIA
ncbi:hypothetical protein SeMB42_g01343 [Synchytrium endobioticum]|uniref:Xaa-Pro aminopeptidase n=1 Tax=Synchytrium endobioticum TaxID=286115 RepID=A0A507CY70_9FUNG|nr:hypothetical protein SeLEV6574_g04714 [Synchytrium endobioticum]TPX52559.1 hypothetical protein SeMB42_g01343 [Synchytrium endobioticum]